jgi:CHAD domain-containing protein
MSEPAADMSTTSSPRSRRRPAGLSAAPRPRSAAAAGAGSKNAAAGSRPPLAEALGRRLEALAGHLHAALEGEPRAIHQARVATRRLREILPVATDVRTGRGARLQRRLKRLTRALGPVRELDVACGLLTDRAAGRRPPGVVALRAHLTARRLVALDALRDACDPRRATRVLERLTDVVRDLERAGRRGVGDLPPRERRRLARRVMDRAGDLGVAVDASGAILIVDRVHAVRIAAKRLRYALEVTGELRLAKTGALVSSLKAMQDVLGELHDLDVLRAEAARARQDLPPASIVATDLEQMTHALDADIRQLHARYLRGARSLALLTDRARDRIAPCLDPSIST